MMLLTVDPTVPCNAPGGIILCLSFAEWMLLPGAAEVGDAAMGLNTLNGKERQALAELFAQLDRAVYAAVRQGKE
jgi:hypothetical protein